MENNLQVGVFDCSEDEMNNFKIDMWLLMKEMDKPKTPTNEISAVAGKTVSITLTPKNYTGYHDIDLG